MRLLPVAILVGAWIIYPAAMALIARLLRRRRPESHAPSAPCDVVIATREAPDLVARRVTGILGTHGRDVVGRVIVAVDYRSAHAMDAYEQLLEGTAILLRGDPPGGKAAALNAGMRAAATDIVVLLDTAQVNPPGSLAALVVDIRSRPDHGAVSGVVIQQSGDAVMDRYWRYELAIRHGQDALHSIVTSSGQITAVRRELWLPLPDELICDDLFLTSQLVLRGYRVGSCDQAIAVDGRIFTREQHFQRKVRTLTGLYQFIGFMPAVLMPWRNPIWLHFVTHKLMRFATPFLVAILGLQLLWWMATAHRDVLLIAIGAAAMAALVVGALRPDVLSRAWSQLLWLARLQSVPLLALANGIRGNWSVWRMHQPLPKLDDP